ncbi:MAG: ParB/RepB/Spo0J family partition protein [Myxococcales bacterium]|nr:ParB/RepB/Spo0J family partition protein [Myxococcales bacterium]
MDPAKAPKRRPLGRGLDALLPQASSPGTAGSTLQLPVEDLYPSHHQPRGLFDDSALEELAESIRELGILEPLLVRKRVEGGYNIVAGERRWRAAQRAGMLKVPVFVRELTDKQAFEAALVENIQREELGPVETARAFQRLLEDFGHTQESMAKRIGKNRSTIANAVRLLKLPPAVLSRLETGELTEGHGRALLGLSSQEQMQTMAKEAVIRRWSVRETEREVRRATEPPRATGMRSINASANVRDLETRLSRAMGTKVAVIDRHGRGRISISYGSYDELDAILKRIPTLDHPAS